MAKPKNETPADPLEAAIAKLNGEYGPGSVVILGKAERQKIDAIPTGSIGLDNVLGVGGIPRGRITEIYGPESSGKSTLALGVVAQAQEMGLTVAYIDAEHAVDLEYAEHIGVNTDTLLFSQPDSGEEGLVTARTLAASRAVGLIVVDSVPSLTPLAEINGEIGDAHIALLARLMSQGLRVLVPVMHSTNTACVFINQLREKPGVVFGPNETQPGGRALKFYTSVRLEIKRIDTLKTSGNEDPVGTRVKVKAVKNKVGPPLRIAQFNVLFGEGIDWAGEIVDLAVEFSLVKKSGAFYTLAPGEPAAQGREAARMRLHEQPELAQDLLAAVKGAYAEGRTPAPPKPRQKAGDRANIAPVDFGLEPVAPDG